MKQLSVRLSAAIKDEGGRVLRGDLGFPRREQPPAAEATLCEMRLIPAMEFACQAEMSLTARLFEDALLSSALDFSLHFYT